MRDLSKYKGVIPAFYACYDENGNISPEGVQSLTRYFVEKGVKGVYVNGSSGECIYQSVEDRKIVLENVMKAADGKLTVINHVACNNTKDSMELAKHAQSLGVDAIAAIPPIYFRLPEHAIAKYWNDISSAAPDTDFVIYNIPQLAGVALSVPLLQEMLKNPRVIGVKNSSMPVQDIQMWRDEGAVVYVAAIPRATLRPVFVREERNTLKAYYRVADENIAAPPLMVRAWQRAASGTPALLRFSKAEQALLHLLRAAGSVDPATFHITAHISRNEAEDAITRLASMGLVEFTYSHPGFLLIPGADEAP